MIFLPGRWGRPHMNQAVFGHEVNGYIVGYVIGYGDGRANAQIDDITVIQE